MVAAISAGIIGENGRAGLAALAFLLLAIPLSGTFHCPAGWPRWTMGGATLLLALVGLGGVALISSGRWLVDEAQIVQRIKQGLAYFSIFTLGILLSSFLANGLARVQLRR